MDKDLFTHRRKSQMLLNEIYFWTATITRWHKLLTSDRYKDVAIGSLEYLCNANKVDVFAFVIMPNHIHLIWKMKALNGKESPHGSFLKFTAHEFKKLLVDEGMSELNKYSVDSPNKKYEFWQRDSLAIHLFTPEVAFQKLDYVHNNPLAEHWQLAQDPSDYKYSSASYYEQNDTRFSFLKDLREYF